MVVEGQRFERKGHALPDIKQILADERVSFEKHKDVEPYGALFIEGVDDVQPEDKARLERAINQIAAYTDGILIKDYFEQRHLEQDGRRAWRRMMYERLAPYPDLLRQFRHLIMFDKMRRGTMDRFVVRSIDTIEQYLSKEGIYSNQTIEFDRIVAEIPAAISAKLPYYDRLKDEDKMLVVEKMDEIARRLLHLFAPVNRSN